MVEEEPSVEALSADLPFEWDTVVQRWESGAFVPAKLTDVPAGLLEEA